MAANWADVAAPAPAVTALSRVGPHHIATITGRVPLPAERTPLSPSADPTPPPAPLAAPVQRVRGTNDYLPPDDARLRHLETALRGGFEAFGYQGVRTPILEPLELYLRKSGDEIVARMYTFSHWNRQLALRPELTASVMRVFVDHLQGRGLPVRVHYSGPAFRYERPSRGRYREFTQVGVELIGAAGGAADAEVLHLACAGLEALGVRDYRVVVGHLGAVLQLLGQLGLSEHAQGLILDRMEAVARGRLSPEEAVAQVVALLGGGPGDGVASPELPTLPASLLAMPPEQATAVAAEILRRASLPIDGGARSAQRIIQRLLARANRPDPTRQVRAAFEFVAELHACAGPVAGLQRLRSLLQQRGLSTQPLEEVESALDALHPYGPPSQAAQWEVDLSLARGLRYYTGLVFEIHVETADGPMQVCGGGRYDDLIRALGARESVPACGFAFGLERLDQVVAPHTSSSPNAAPRLLMVPVTPEDHRESVALAQQLRAAGIVVEHDLRWRGPKAALRHADRAGMCAVAIVGSQEREHGTVLLRDMRARVERAVPRDELVRAVRELFAP